MKDNIILFSLERRTFRLLLKNFRSVMLLLYLYPLALLLFGALALWATGPEKIRLPACNESDPLVDAFFNRWVTSFLENSRKCSELINLKDGESCMFKGLDVTRFTFPDNDNGWSIKAKPNSEIWLYITDDGEYAEYMFPFTPKGDSEQRPLSTRNPSKESSDSQLHREPKWDNMSGWGKGIYTP